MNTRCGHCTSAGTLLATVAKPNQFAAFVDGLIASKYETAQAMAHAIGMTLSALLRARAQGTLNIENCLSLAADAGVNPSDVLRMADKAKVAERIEMLYGPMKEPLTHIDRQLLALSPGAKKQVLRLITELEPAAHAKRSA